MTRLDVCLKILAAELATSLSSNSREESFFVSAAVSHRSALQGKEDEEEEKEEENLFNKTKIFRNYDTLTTL